MWVILAYALALGAAVAAAGLYPGKSRIFTVLIADLAATMVIYIFGRIFRNSSFYDPYWSLAPIAITGYWAATGLEKPGIGQLAMLAVIAFWGLRLTWHWARNWGGLGHEDWRYTELREKSKKWFWLVELAGIDLMPTLVVFLGATFGLPRADFPPGFRIDGYPGRTVHIRRCLHRIGGRCATRKVYQNTSRRRGCYVRRPVGLHPAPELSR